MKIVVAFITALLASILLIPVAHAAVLDASGKVTYDKGYRTLVIVEEP